MDSNSPEFAPDGQPLYFLRDKRVPVVESYNQLRSFDQTKYFSDFFDFASQNKAAPDYEIEQAKTNFFADKFGNRMGILSRILKKTLVHKYSLSIKQINTTPTTQLLEMLYAIGCPEIYTLHITAAKKRPFEKMYEPNTSLIVPNPIGDKPDVNGEPGHQDVYMTPDIAETKKYTSASDDKPYVIAFPYLEITSLLDKRHVANQVQAYTETSDSSSSIPSEQGKTIQHLCGLNLSTNTVYFNKTDTQDLSDITTKMRVFLPPDK